MIVTHRVLLEVARNNLNVEQTTITKKRVHTTREADIETMEVEKKSTTETPIIIILLLTVISLTSIKLSKK